MKTVTRDEFFAALYNEPGDVMPSIVSGYDQREGYRSEWKNVATRRVFGYSFGGTFLMPAVYQLAETGDK